MNPDCRDGKHAACNGDGWDYERDEPTPCTCICHLSTSAGLSAWGSAVIDDIIDACRPSWPNPPLKPDRNPFDTPALAATRDTPTHGQPVNDADSA